MGDEMVTVKINGRSVEAAPGTLLLHVLRDEGIEVPTLCHDDRLTPYGGCRLCVVERRDGRGGLIPACSTPVQPGMEIETDTDMVLDSRRETLKLLVLNHRMECPVCERNGDCRLQDLLYEYGVGEERLPFELVEAPREERSPVIVRDPEKCVLCGKCVRICDEIQGEAAIGLVSRGLEAQITTFLETTLDCEFCGQCVNACPVGALVARPFVTDAPPWLRERATTTCSLCSCGCQVAVETYEGEIHSVRGADVAQGPNHGNLCAKGWLGWDLLSSKARLKQPLVRKNGRLEKVSWSEALDTAADLLREARDAGQAAVGVATARMTTEDGYLMQRLMRGALGTPHVGQAPVGGTKGLDGMWDATGAPASTATMEQIRDADVILVLRGDPKRTHPIVKNEIVESVKHRGQHLVLAHALSGGLERHAEMFLGVRPGSEVELTTGVMAALVERRPELLDAFRGVEGFDGWLESLAGYGLSAVCDSTGAESRDLERLVDLLASARNVLAVVVTGNGIPGDERATATLAAQLTALVNGSPEASRVLVLGERANVQGLVDVGVAPEWLPGHRRVDDEVGREKVAEVWGVDVPSDCGWSIPEITRRCAGGDVGVLYLAGADPVCCWPKNLGAHEMLEGARGVIVQDAFLTPTARLADVVLPVAILGERSGSLVGSDGERRQLRPAVPTPVPLTQDGDVFVELGRRLGADLPEGEALEEELGRLVSWPASRSPIVRLGALGGPEQRPAVSGCLLDAAAHLFHSGQTTTHSQTLQHLSPTIAVRMGHEEAARLGVKSGELVQVAADGTVVMGRARVDSNVRSGTVIMPCQQSADGSTNLLFDEAQVLEVDVRRCS